MSIYYLTHDIDNMKAKRSGAFYTVDTFKPNTRVEVKMAYLALLNTLLDEAKFNEKQEAYLEKNLTQAIQNLALLANKKVDEAKMQGYIKELDEMDLLDIKDEGYYLRRLV